VLVELEAPGDLLVVGSRGRGGFAGLLLGSVSQHCATHAKGPVVVVPPTAPLPPERGVVVGVDGSDGSRAALRWAADEARVRGAQLTVVNAWWQPVTVSPLGEPVSLQQRVDLRPRSERLLREAASWIDPQVAGSLDVELLPVESPTAPALLECAKGAGLLVVGSRGRGGFAGLLLGSVSQHCVRHATCAVVVVPSA
jgi:nucleotide-binding universal stress UspA family protein